MANTQSITMNQWYGGMVESDAFGSDSQYSFGYNLDGKSQPEVLKLGRDLQNTTQTGQDLMFCNIDSSYYFGENGAVYSGGVLVYTLPGNYPIRNCIKFGTMFLLFYDTGTDTRIAMVDNSTGTPNRGTVQVQWGIDENLNPLSIDRKGCDPYMTAINDSDDILYFGTGNSVYRILLTTAPFIEKAITLEDCVVSVTRVGSQISIYLQQGRKYFWDGFSKQHDGYVDIGERVRFVQDTRNYDYVVSGKFSSQYSKFYMSQGQAFQLIKTASFTKSGPGFLEESWKHAYDLEGRYGNFCIAVDQSNVYIPNNDIGQPVDRGIEAFGNRIQGLPQGTSIEYASDNIADIGSVFAYTFNAIDNIGFTYRDDAGDCFISTIPYFRTANPIHLSQGSLTSKKYMLGGPIQQRQKKYKIRYSSPPGTTISIYNAIDGSADYQLVQTLPNTQDDHDIYSISVGDPFYEIQWRIDMSTSDNTKTPLIYSITMLYEPI